MRDEFMMTRQGKQYVLFAGLLDEAHSRGLVGIDTELVQVPEEMNGQVAIVKATVQIEDAGGSGDLRTFSGIGDASPQNVSRNIVPHLIRMAETRAKARALRDAVNVGATALEELSDGDDGPATQSSQSGGARREAPGLREAKASKESNGTKGAESRGGERLSGTRGASETDNTGNSGNSDDAGGSGTNGSTSGPRPVEDGGGRARGDSRAPKSQIDFIKTLAEEWRGEKGVERLESRIGKSLSELTRDEAEQWIDRLTPKEEVDGQ